MSFNNAEPFYQLKNIAVVWMSKSGKASSFVPKKLSHCYLQVCFLYDQNISYSEWLYADEQQLHVLHIQFALVPLK